MKQNRLLLSIFIILFELFILPVFAKTDRKTEFKNAITKNDSKKVEKLINKSSEKEKIEGLMIAIQERKISFVLEFLDSGVDVNSFDEYYNTPLITACLQPDNFEIIKLLLEKGANVNSINSSYTTPLLAACQCTNNEDILKLLIENGVDINSSVAKNKETILMYTIKKGYHSYTEFFIRNGANTNSTNEYGETPLIFAVKNNSFSDISALIKNGADVNAKDCKNQTALFYAIQANDIKMTKELLAHNAKISINGDKGETLAELAENRGNTEILEILKKYGYVQPPTELWNGFTDQMTKAQVIARANKLLNAKWEDNSFLVSSMGNRKDFEYNNYDDNCILPEPITSIFYFSKYSEFRSDFSIKGNIRFHFYDNILYSIEIQYKADIMDIVIEKAKNTYGNNYKKIGYIDIDNSLFWDLKRKEVYIVKYDQTFLVLSKRILQEYRTFFKQKQEKEKALAEEKRKKLSDSLSF